MVKVTTVRSTSDAEWLVCETARGDYMKSPPWETDRETLMHPIKGGTLEEKKENFMLQLMNGGHWGPWEHPAITFGIEGMSRVTLAQLTRHRLASFDIQSQRYVTMGENYEVPPSITAEDVVSRKGGRKKLEGTPDERQSIFERAVEHAEYAYHQLVERGIPVEDARYVLPNAQVIHGHITVNARSLMHIIAIRSFGDAQWEIRELVSQMLELAKDWMPFTFTYFEKKMKDRNVLAP